MKSAFMVAAPHSGSGKTTLSLGISRALTMKGLKVQGFKVGPDYIDSSILARATFNDVYNLDRVLIKDDDLRRYFYNGIFLNDVAIVEGVMGFFDSFDTINFFGSSYDLSKELNLPILFVINSLPSLTYYSMLIKGMEALLKDFDAKIGVVINKVKKNYIDERVAPSLRYHTGAELLGILPENEKIKIPSRHLGLFGGFEIDDTFIDTLAHWISSNLNLDDILSYFSYDLKEEWEGDRLPQKKRKDKRCFIAKDNAFSFYYKNNLDIIESYGYEIRYFSPLNNYEIDNADLVYIGGGYPEMYASELSKSYYTIESLKKLLLEGVPIFAECGGFIYLGRGIQIDEKRYPMAGLFDVSFEMTKELKMLGYVTLELNKESNFFYSGRGYYGHQFRYSKIKDLNEPLVSVVRRLGKDTEFMDGILRENCFGSYTHFNFSTTNIFEKLFGEGI